MFGKLIQLIKDFFGVTYKEARGLIVLLFFLMLFVLIPIFQQMYYLSKPLPVTQIVLFDSLLAVEKEEKSFERLFRFDPNIISHDSLTVLGLDPHIATRIINYRSKGGKFRKKDDLLKIYDIPQEWYDKVKDSVAIRPETDLFSGITNTKLEVTSLKPSPKAKTPEEISPEVMPSFDINTADTTALKRVYGIGSVLSNRIVKFREKLGGFVDMSQLQEVYGLNDSTLIRLHGASFLDQDYRPKKIFINTVEFKDLLGHPYIDYEQTKALINYRQQHGSFQSQSDLEAIHLLDDSVIVKLIPYLSFE